MKTSKTYLIIILAFIAIKANAQLKVDITGKVGVYSGTSIINSHLQVGDVTNYNQTITAIGSELRVGSYNSSTPYAFFQARDYSTRSFGMIIRVQSSGSVYNALTILPNGNIGIGNSFTPTYNLDVVGQINASVAVRAANIVLTSDERLKSNITKLPDLSINSILNLQGVTYKLKTNGSALLAKSLNPIDFTKGDTTNSQTNLRTQDTAFFNRNHIGFIAQDVQKIFPELVYPDKDGILAIDYIGFIPLLVESIKGLNNNHLRDSLNLKNLQNKLINVETQLNQKSGQQILNSTLVTAVDDESIGLPLLYQSDPNPFNQNTSITYYLPLNITTAKIYLYNMQGIQIKSYPINEPANGNILIQASELVPGMYLYTLIADGKEIDTKKMILTD